MKILLHLFEFKEVYLIISFGSDPVRELHGPLVHWSTGSSWSGGHPSLSGQQFKSHAPQNISLSRKYEANILLRIHNSKNIILFCPSNKNKKMCLIYFSFIAIKSAEYTILFQSTRHLSFLINSKQRKRVKRKGANTD